MKICIIGLPRTRSSLLLETLSTFYSIDILGDNINTLFVRRGDMYLKALKRFVDINSSYHHGVVRYHPLQLVEGFPYRILDFDMFNFQQYNKFYFTYRRSLPDFIASKFVAVTFDKFTYKSEEEIIKNINPITFTKENADIIKDYNKSIDIMNKLKEYLKPTGVPIEDLYYEDIPEYIEKNFPNTKTSHVETNYDYKQIITNYDDLLKFYNEITNE